MDYTSLTIDTSILVGDSIYLETELISRLKPITEGPKNIVISEVVLREMHRKLRHALQKQRSQLKSHIRSSLNNGILNAAQKDACETLLASMVDADTRAAEIVEGFIQEYKIEKVGFSEIKLDSLIDDYFSGTAPFADSGDKKHEFPDALALKSLERWAEKNNKLLLCVSEDADWKRFCEGKHHIDCVDSLPDALDKMLEDSEEIREKTATFLNEDLSNLRDTIISQLQGEPISAQGESSYGDITAEATIADISFDDFPGDVEENGFLILEETIETITIRLSLNVSVSLDGELNYLAGSKHEPAEIISIEEIEEDFEDEMPIEVKIKKQRGKLSEPELKIIGVSIPDTYIFSLGYNDIF